MAQNRWVLGARPRTLPAAVVPVLVGTACAFGFADTAYVNDVECPDAACAAANTFWTRGFAAINWPLFLLAVVVALALQIGTNYANDYSDGKRGTDDPSKRVGPPRLVGNGLATPGQVRAAMLIAFAVAGLAGLTLAWFVGWELIPVGLAALAAGYFYTGGPKPYGYLGLGEAFVFTFFGVVATVGSTYVQLERHPFSLMTGEALWLSFGASVMVGCLATALLVINNLRDIPGDTISGKRTLAVKLGDQRTRVLYCLLMTIPYLLLPFVGGLSGRPVASLAVAAIMVSTTPIKTVLGGAKGMGLIPVLAGTARAQLVFGVLLTAGLIISTYI